MAGQAPEHQGAVLPHFLHLTVPGLPVQQPVPGEGVKAALAVPPQQMGMVAVRALGGFHRGEHMGENGGQALLPRQDRGSGT